MPRPKKPPRLAIRKERLDNGTTRRVWIIRDGGLYRRTGCLEAQAGAAEERLRDYLAEKRRPDTSIRVASKVRLCDILDLYLEAKSATVSRPEDLDRRIGRLNEFWGKMTADAIKGETCRQYVKQRGATAVARRELEDMRAAVHHYEREYGLDVTPRFTLPERGVPRSRWLTRSEAARLLWAAYRSPYHKHLVRFILIGLYTGTRHKAILSLQWMPNTTGGWVDLERGVLHRRGQGERETKKRRPPTRLSSRLLSHLLRWRDRDKNLGSIVRYEGRTLKRLEKSFRHVREAAGLGTDVVPHCLRHTRATWLMQSGKVDMWEAASSLGMTVEMLQNVYGHHHPDFQKNAAEAY